MHLWPGKIFILLVLLGQGIGGQWNKEMDVNKTTFSQAYLCVWIVCVPTLVGKQRGEMNKTGRQKGQTYRPFMVHLSANDHLNIKQAQ